MGSTNTVPQALFGPGILYLTRTDIANATPTNVGYVNEFSTDIKFDLKELYGQNQLPLVVARGTAKCTGKIKAATLSGQALNALLFGTGTSVVTGTQYGLTQTGLTLIPATPYQITPTIPSSGVFNSDLGVVYTSGEPLTFIPSGTPAAGQYTQSAGAYTFSSADHTAGLSVNISFSYSFTNAAGQTITINNPLIGQTPTFQLDYMNVLYGSIYYMRLFAAVGGGWTEGFKLTDFSMPEYDFGFFANASQQLGFIALATQA